MCAGKTDQLIHLSSEPLWRVRHATHTRDQMANKTGKSRRTWRSHLGQKQSTPRTANDVCQARTFTAGSVKKQRKGAGAMRCSGCSAAETLSTDGRGEKHWGPVWVILQLFWTARTPGWARNWGRTRRLMGSCQKDTEAASKAPHQSILGQHDGPKDAAWWWWIVIYQIGISFLFSGWKLCELTGRCLRLMGKEGDKVP